jgi:2-polyprenyl-6-methoxyphenol hydroxylase-like FAD-dependent oxidoreductase
MADDFSTTCLIAGGGPAGMMCGYLLARAGVDVIVLEKHADFLRDFRGDTVHPSTLQVMHELGLLEDFLKRPHQEITHAGGQIGNRRVNLADFTHLPTRCKFIAFMPQWDFLDFLAEKAKALPNFRLMMETEATDLLREGARVTGVVARTNDGECRIAAHLTIGADGRHSVLRERSGLQVMDLGAPIDVLWMRLKHRPGDENNAVLGHIEAGQVLVMLYRGDYWQCALVIRKGGYDDLRKDGLEALRKRVAMAPRRLQAGTTSSCSPLTSTGSRAGTAAACSSSAMRRTRCRRSAASASIWRSRTAWPRRIFSRAPFGASA